MKKLLLVILAVLLLSSLIATPALADPANADQKVAKGIYYLVTKDSSWNPLPRSSNAFGMGKFSLDENTLTMHLVAHKLTPDSWYQIEVNDKNAPPWTVVSNTDVQYYVRTDEYGDADATFVLDVSALSGSALEVNLKTAGWANTPGGWVYTPGWGYNYVLYGATTIPVSSP